MTLQRQSLIGIVLVNALSFACADEDTSLLEREPDENRSPSQPAEENAESSSAEDAMDDAMPGEVGSETDPLLSSPEAPSNGAPDATGAAGNMGSPPAPEQSSDAGPGAAPPQSSPPGSTPPPPALPDLVLDAEYLEATIQQAMVDASLDSCLINEKCITGMGLRRVVRFGTRSGNIGTADLVAGRPALDNPVWEYDACHDHFHFEGYAEYELIDAATSAVLPVGVKHGFCLRDLGVWDPSVPSERCGVYDCDYQGLGVGCYDVYVPELDCQWVDITDVPPGEYQLRVTINSEQRIQELDRSNNSATVRILITPETVQPMR